MVGGCSYNEGYQHAPICTMSDFDPYFPFPTTPYNEHCALATTRVRLFLSPKIVSNFSFDAVIFPAKQNIPSTYGG